MLDHLDNLLRHLFIDRVDGIDDESQVGFEPPDEQWRTHVGTLAVGGQPANALNVYLADLRDNRQLHSNQRVRQHLPDASGAVIETAAPRRIDCHYLISAWSPATRTPAVEPSVDEHALLYRAAAALNAAEPLVPRRVYAPNPLPPGFPAYAADDELPAALLPTEGFPKLAEFWGTMGNGHRWKPALYLVVTVPIVYEPQPAGAMVTTRISEYRLSGQPAARDVLIEIGGTVLDPANPQPGVIAQAWVLLQTGAGIELQRTRTNALGRFQFAGLAAGDYRLRASFEGRGERMRDIRVPSPTGEYDVTF